jgi:small subunit ribosomal protein S1
VKLYINVNSKLLFINNFSKWKDSAEEKAAMEDYNKQSSNAVEGATLGDLLKQAKD